MIPPQLLHITVCYNGSKALCTWYLLRGDFSIEDTRGYDGRYKLTSPLRDYHQSYNPIKIMGGHSQSIISYMSLCSLTNRLSKISLPVLLFLFTLFLFPDLKHLILAWLYTFLNGFPLAQLTTRDSKPIIKSLHTVLFNSYF